MQNLREKWSKANKGELLIGGKYTKCTLFLLPILGIYHKDFIFAEKNCLINCHINLDNRELIVILYNEEFEPLTSLIQKITNNPLFSESWLENQGEEILLSFKLSGRYKFSSREDVMKADFDNFVAGKYSRLSDELKEILGKAYGTTPVLGSHRASIHDALHPTTEKRYALAKEYDVDIRDVPSEVMGAPNLNIEQYKSYKELEVIYGIK